MLVSLLHANLKTDLQVESLNESYKELLRNHEALKEQNDKILVRVGLEQQFALHAATKGRQQEDDEKRAGLGNGKRYDAEGDAREKVGLVQTARR